MPAEDSMLPLALLPLSALADPAATCQAATTRYHGCVIELLGPEATVQAPTPAAVASCAADPPMVKMYETCTPEPACKEFLACVDRMVMQPPPPSATTSRPEQCWAHVEQNKRGMAMQLVTKLRPDEELDEPRTCLFGTPRPVDECLRPGEAAELKALLRRRQEDCVAWAQPMASCILQLPDRKDCAPETYPKWR